MAESSSVPMCPACKAPLNDEHNLRSGAVCPTLEPPSETGEIFVTPGWRLIVEPSSEHFADGSIAARFRMERTKSWRGQ